MKYAMMFENWKFNGMKSWLRKRGYSPRAILPENQRFK
jgi:hypothetical protein